LIRLASTSVDGRNGMAVHIEPGKDGRPRMLPCPYCVSYDLESAAVGPASSCVEMTCLSCHFNLWVFVGDDTLMGERAGVSVASAFLND
jgi:hypothetical protein